MKAKQKTIKAISKKFKVTRRGKVIKRKNGQNHLNAKESGNITRMKKNDVVVAHSSAKVIKQLLNQ